MENIYGLIGRSLKHSFSKYFFEKKFSELNLMNFKYELWEVDDLKNIKSFIDEKKDVKGFNITIPYKEEIIGYVDGLSDEVKIIGACNCVKINNGKWWAYNTDWWGFLKMIESKLEKHHTAAMILGSGGSAKAVAYALNHLEMPYVFISRHGVMHENNSKSFVLYNDLNQFHFKAFPVIINTTPLGMYPDVNIAPPINIDFIDEKNFVIDLIYNPSKTLLLKESEKRGAKVLNGLEMLYLQAEKSWYIWQN